jgi:hypothetical protein
LSLEYPVPDAIDNSIQIDNDDRLVTINASNNTGYVDFDIGYIGAGQSIGTPTGPDAGDISIINAPQLKKYTVDTTSISGPAGGIKRFSIKVSEPTFADITYNFEINVFKKVEYTLEQIGGVSGVKPTTGVKVSFTGDISDLTIQDIKTLLGIGIDYDFQIANPMIININPTEDSKVYFEINKNRYISGIHTVDVYRGVPLPGAPPPDTPITQQLDLTSLIFDPATSSKVTTFTAAQYNVISISWSLNSEFGDWLAIITISPKTGFTTERLRQSSFTHSGADLIKFDSATNEITIRFPKQYEWLEGTLTITGTPKVGETLTAVFTPAFTVGIRAPVGTPLYTWYRGDAQIIRTSSDNFYIPTAADLYKTIRVNIKYTNPGVIFSTPTEGVIPADPPPPFEGTAGLFWDTGHSWIGSTVIAAFIGTGAIGTPSYKWEKSYETSNIWTVLTGVNGPTYNTSVRDYRYRFKVTITYTNGYAVTTPSDIVSRPALKGSVSVQGTIRNPNGKLEPGDWLTAVYTPDSDGGLGNGTGIPSFRWKGSGELVENAWGYTIKETDSKSAVSLEMTWSDQTGSLYYNFTGDIDFSYVTGDVSITGGTITDDKLEAHTGDTLEAHIADNVNAIGGVPFYTWKAGGTVIRGPDRNPLFGVQDDAINKQVTVEVSYNNKTGSIESGPTEKVIGTIHGTPRLEGEPQAGRDVPNYIIDGFNGDKPANNIGPPIIQWYIREWSYAHDDWNSWGKIESFGIHLSTVWWELPMWLGDGWQIKYTVQCTGLEGILESIPYDIQSYKPDR